MSHRPGIRNLCVPSMIVAPAGARDGGFFDAFDVLPGDQHEAIRQNVAAGYVNHVYVTNEDRSRRRAKGNSNGAQCGENPKQHRPQCNNEPVYSQRSESADPRSSHAARAATTQLRRP